VSSDNLQIILNYVADVSVENGIVRPQTHQLISPLQVHLGLLFML